MKNINLRSINILTGASIILMTFVSIFSFGAVLSTLYIENDPTLTLQNIEANRGLYTLGNIGWIIILITDLIVSFGFYYYIKTINKNYGLLSGLTRLIYTCILAYAITFLFKDNISTFTTIFNSGLILFGFHLIFSGIGFNNPRVPKALAYLLILAGCGYIITSSIDLFLPSLSSIGNIIEMIMLLPMTIAEFSIAIWLIVKAGKNSKQVKITALQDVA